MNHEERARDYLCHILQAIDRASRYIATLADAQELARHEQVQDAVVRNLEIIGEAAARLQSVAPHFAASHPELPWQQMRGMRNKMIHEYFAVDWAIVWSTIKRDLPRLKQQIDAVLADGPTRLAP